MSYLSFEPALDAYHAVFRLVRLAPLIAEVEALPVDTVRILDFYVVFPFKLADFRVRREDRRIKAVGKQHEADRPFAKLPDDKQLFEQMRIFQAAALETLVAKQVFDLEALERREVKVANLQTDGLLETKVANASVSDMNLMEALRVLAKTYPLLGPDGLKARSGLMEYRYDPV